MNVKRPVEILDVFYTCHDDHTLHVRSDPIRKQKMLHLGIRKEMADKLKIPINKSKALWLTLGCLVFVTISIWLWTVADKQTRRSPMMIKIVSVAGISFFGLGLIIGPKKLLDKKAGLIIDDQGIRDNAGIGRGRFIAWKNIEKFKIVSVKKRTPYLSM